MMLILERKMETTKITKRHENQWLAGIDPLTSQVSGSIGPTLLFLVIFGAFRGFYFGIYADRSNRCQAAVLFTMVKMTVQQ